MSELGATRIWPIASRAMGSILFAAWIGAASLALPERAAAGGFPAQTMSPNTVTQLPDPETVLAVPPDGRLDGYQFAGKIVGVATGTRLGSGASRVTAPAGQHLWVFGLEWTGGTGQDGTRDQVDSTLVVDGTRITFPAEAGSPNNSGSLQANSTWQTGDTYWVASVPAGATDVAIELASGGYAQTFSLTKMAREGPQPAILYRDPTNWELDQPLTDEHDIPLVDPSGNVTGVVLPVVLPGVTMSWFGPDSPSNTPTDPTAAWLEPDLTTSGSSSSSENMCFEHTLPASDITLTLPGQPRPLTSTSFTGKGPDTSSNGEGAFTAAYGFQVPADTTTATVTVNPGSSIQADAAACFLFSAYVPQGKATFTLTLSTSAWTPPAGASNVPAAIHTLASANTAPGHSATGFAITPVIIGVVLAAAAAGATLVLYRRWRTALAGSAGGSVSDYAGPRPPPPAAEEGPQAEAPPPVESNSAPQAVPPTAVAVGVTVAPESTPPMTDPVPPRRILIPIPEEAPPVLGTVVVRVLGPPDVLGWAEDVEPPSPRELEILAFLAFHRGRRYRAQELSTELGRGQDQALDAGTIRRYINGLRQGVGPRRIPGARSSGGYGLVDVTTDAEQFEALTIRAAAADTAASKAQLLADALLLVRGAPFAGTPEGSYGWADVDEYVRGALSNMILNAATTLYELALSHGDTDLAAWAVRRALLAWPTDEALYERLLQAAVTYSQVQLARAWTEVNDRLKAEGETPSAELYEFYRRLREGPGRPQ
jgi:DNA-binding SARP family transcriptional activator